MQEEQNEVERLTKERLDTDSVDKLVAMGYCLDDLGGRWEHKMEFGRPCASFGHVGKKASNYLHWNRFE